jgi:hypothetical protein
MKATTTHTRDDSDRGNTKEIKNVTGRCKSPSEASSLQEHIIQSRKDNLHCSLKEKQNYN